MSDVEFETEQFWMMISFQSLFCPFMLTHSKGTSIVHLDSWNEPDSEDGSGTVVPGTNMEAGEKEPFSVIMKLRGLEIGFESNIISRNFQYSS